MHIDAKVVFLNCAASAPIHITKYEKVFKVHIIMYKNENFPEV